MRLVAVLLTVLVVGGCVSRTGESSAPSDDGSSSSTAPPSAPAPASSSASSSDLPGGSDGDRCAFVPNPAEPAPVGLPPDEPVDGGRVVLSTSSGEIVVQLTAVGTPCTVRSFAHLARSGFYEGTRCHRLTAAATLKVLQCGDPQGDGTGGPGYTVPDELTAPLAPVPGSDGLVLYPRGAVAMANSGAPDSGGSQFFLVYGDSTLPAAYTLFGSVSAGLATLDAIAARGVGAGGNSAEDGPPAVPVTLESAVVD